MPEKYEKKTLQRVLIIVFCVAFLGTLVLSAVEMFKSPSQPVNNAATNTNPGNPPISELQKQAEGYETVLKREPNNPLVLQKLVETRLQMNDLQGAIAPMEKLVKLYPEQKELKTLLDAIKQQAAQPKPKSEK
ncbi:MAG: tetratricopeptide repeat protein [Hydrococcus sp. RM1_1_31]|nr:tetratricopeptide repeat protein [Hydrococcus sp. RM1_1_31]